MSDLIHELRQGAINNDDYRWRAADEITTLRADIISYKIGNKYLQDHCAEMERLIIELIDDCNGYVQLLTEENNHLRAEVERLKALEADYDLHEREMIDLEEDNGRLTARVDELEGALEAWSDAVRIDVVMEGPQYMGVSSTLGRKAWEKTRAALSASQPAQKAPAP